MRFLHEFTFSYHSIRPLDCDCTFCLGYTGLYCLKNNINGYPKLDLDIGYNPINCDCRDYKIISMSRYYVFSHDLDKVNCEEPADLFNVKVGFGMWTLLSGVRSFGKSWLSSAWALHQNACAELIYLVRGWPNQREAVSGVTKCVCVYCISCITDHCWCRLEVYYNAIHCVKWVLENTAKVLDKSLDFLLTTRGNTVVFSMLIISLLSYWSGTLCLQPCVNYWPPLLLSRSFYLRRLTLRCGFMCNKIK